MNSLMSTIVIQKNKSSKKSLIKRKFVEPQGMNLFYSPRKLEDLTFLWVLKRKGDDI